MRESSIPLSRAFAEGVISRGVDVVEAGLGSTDLLYFAAGSLDLPGAMFTASHNPAQYNGIKLCRAGAAPDRPGLRARPRSASGPSATATTGSPARVGSVSPRDVLADYAAYLHSLVDLSTDPAPEGRRRRRERHGRAHRPGRPRPGCRWRSSRCTSSSTARSPTTRRTRWTRRTWSTSRRPSGSTARTSAWPSTATPTASSSSTRTATRSAPRRSRPWSPCASWPRAAGRRSSTT